MKRDWLLDKLDLVHPALGGGMIPVFGHFWFTGTHLLAYDDQIGVQTPLVTEFTGAVPETLRNLLKASSAPDVELAPNGASVRVKAAGLLAKLPILPARDFLTIFQMPKSALHAIDGAAKEALFTALDYCMLGVSRDVSRQEHRGVTIVPDGSSCAFYATNSFTMSRSIVAASDAFQQRALVPVRFVKALLRMGRSFEEIKLGVHADHVLAEVGDTQLFGRLLVSDNPLDFASVLDHHWPGQDGFAPLPKLLRRMAERATLVADKGKARLTVQNGQLVVRTKSPTGEIDDTLAQRLDHDDISVLVDPEMFKGIELFTRMHIGEKAVLLAGDDDSHVYLIGASVG